MRCIHLGNRANPLISDSASTTVRLPTSAAGNSGHSVPGKSVAWRFGNHILLWLLTAQSADTAGGSIPLHITGSSNVDISPAAAAAAVATTRLIRTNRRIEKEKRLKARSWFGIRGLNPVCWLFDRWSGLGRTAYSVEREWDAVC